MTNSTRTTNRTSTSQEIPKTHGKASAPKRAGKGVAKGTSVQPTHINRIDAATASTADLLRARSTPPDFILPCFLLGTVGQLVAPGGVGKSYFALQNAISVAIGCDVFGFWGNDAAPFKIKKGRAVYISAEDSQDIVQQRLQDACRGLTNAQRRAVEQNLELVFPDDFSIVKRKRGALAPSDWIEDLHASLGDKPVKPRLIIIDTLNRSLGDANENSASSMAAIQEALKVVAVAFKSSIMLLHHTVKRTGDSESCLRQDAARGSGAGSANCRWQANMALEVASEPSEPLGDQQLDRISYLISKANYCAKPTKRVLVRLKNGVLISQSKLDAHRQVE